MSDGQLGTCFYCASKYKCMINWTHYFLTKCLSHHLIILSLECKLDTFLKYQLLANSADLKPKCNNHSSSMNA